MDVDVIVTETSIEVEITEPELVVELGDYGDGNVRDVILALLTDDTVLGRISGALAAIAVVPEAEAQAGTATTPRIVTASRLKAAIDALAVARVVALVGDTQLVTRSGSTLAGTTVASIVAAAVAAVVDGATDGTLLTRSGSDVAGTSVASIVSASVAASLAEVLVDVTDGYLLTRSGADVGGTSIASIVSTAIAGALAALDAVGSGYLRASSGGGLSAVAGVPWGDLTGVPSTFPPSSHTHPTSDVVGFDAGAVDAVEAQVGAGKVALVSAGGVLGGVAPTTNGRVLGVVGGAWAEVPDVGFADPTSTNGDLFVRLAGAPGRLAAGLRSGRLVIDPATGLPGWALSNDVGPVGRRTVGISSTTSAPVSTGSIGNVLRTSVTNTQGGVCHELGGVYYQRNTASSAAAPNRAYWNVAIGVGGNLWEFGAATVFVVAQSMTADQQIGLVLTAGASPFDGLTSTSTSGGDQVLCLRRRGGVTNFEFFVRTGSSASLVDTLVPYTNGYQYALRCWQDATNSYWQIFRFASRVFSRLGEGSVALSPQSDATSGYGQNVYSVGQSTAVGTAGSIEHNGLQFATLSIGGA